MKKAKFIPATLLAVCALTSCGGGGGSSEEKKVTTVKEFVANLKDGDVSKEQLSKLFEGELLATADEGVKYATMNEKDYAPKWAFVEGLEEEEYEKLVHNLDTTSSFKRYDNDVIITDTDYTCYNYDKDAGEEGLAKDPVKYKDKAYIYKEGDGLRYTYLFDNDRADDSTFTALGQLNDLSKKWFTSGGGLSYLLPELMSVYQEYVDYYGSQIEITETYEGKKANGELHVSQTARLHIMKMYSAERVWGYEDYQKETPTQKTELADGLKGHYVDRAWVVKYEYTIKDGYIQDVTYYGTVYNTILYKDKNYKEGDPLPAYELTDEYIAGLDLFIPETVVWGSKGEIKNPYPGTGYDSYLPHDVVTFTTNGTSLGNYDTTKLPDPTGLREARTTDHGNWFDVQDIIE